MILRNLRKAIGTLDADAAVRLVGLASDIAVMVDQSGIVRDVAIGHEGLAKDANGGAWIGRNWIDTVTLESRPKIEQLLNEATTGSKNGAQWRQVNHPMPNGRLDLPVRYAAMRVGAGGRILAIGRELRSQSLLQQKLLQSQQTLERERARSRYSEMRYRILFQVSAEAILVADAVGLRITDANPSAQRLLEPATKRVTGKTVVELFNPSVRGGLQRMLDALRSAGQAEPVTARLAGTSQEVTVSGSVYKQETATHLLLRLSAMDNAKPTSTSHAAGTIRTLVDRMPDAFLMCDADRRVLMGNSAFLELAQVASSEQIKGQPIERWIGRTSAETDLLFSDLREHGVVRNFQTLVQGELGDSEEVEISAIAVEKANPEYFGFTIRASGRRHAEEPPTGSLLLAHSPGQLAGLVGQVPLKNLVRETTDLIERMCIETALQIVGDNRASAAELLGLSRQSLYIKMRRFGLGELGEN